MNEYQPNYAIPPGETLQEALEEQEITVEVLAKKAQMDKNEIDRILSTTSPITESSAAQLEKGTGIPSTFWINLQKQYEQTKARIL